MSNFQVANQSPPGTGGNPFTGNDIRHLFAYLKANGLKQQLKDLHKRSWIKPTLVLLMDIMSIAFGVYLCIAISMWFLPISCLILGSRQRAFVVLSHEASHHSLFPNRIVNDCVARFFLCPAMFLDFVTFCNEHSQHHKYLGDPELDTDYFHPAGGVRGGWFKFYLKHLLSLKNWKASGIFGAMHYVKIRQRCGIGLWWSALLAILLFSIGLQATLLFAALWIFSRMTVHHAIITFVILSDHVGLCPGGTILKFARNHTSKSLLSRFLHPHNNGYHLTHHLLPGVPCYKLAEAHSLLLDWQPYREAAHCDSW